MSDSETEKQDGGAGSGANANGGEVLPPASSSSGGGVNAQILDAVKQSTAMVMDSAADQGAATAYQKVAQATAFAVQDATDYSRNVENIAMTAQGIIVAKMLADPATNVPLLTPVLATVQEMVIAASTNLATVGTTATTVATAYPSKA